MMYDTSVDRAATSLPSSLPTVRNDDQYRRLSPFVLCCKRLLDLLAALLGLILLSPIFLVIALLIKLDSPGPVFFCHLRVGRRRHRFRMWKFRKMPHDLPVPGPSLTKRYDGRLTQIGAFLERTKLDELPQLFNVLKGDMSLVGPRPEVPQFVEHYPRQWDVVLSVKPGLVGPGQRRFRNESELYPEDCENIEAFYVEHILPAKLSVDADYVKYHGLLRDCVWLIRSVLAVMFGSITRHTIINRRWQIANFVILWMLGLGGTVMVNRLTGQSLGAISTFYITLAAILAKAICLLVFKIPKAIATSMMADDFMRICWCAATSGSMVVCAMLFANHRDVGRLTLFLDTLLFAAVMIVYKLACYSLYVCFFLQEARVLSRRLILGSFLIAPLCVVLVLTVRHGAPSNWSEDLAPLALTMMVLAATIRPGIMLFKPVFSRPDSISWLLREWRKLLIGSLVGSLLMVAGAVLLNERGCGRIDVICDGALYLCVMTCLGLWYNNPPRAPLAPHHIKRSMEARERLLIVGAGIELTAYIGALSALPEPHFEVVGIVTHHRKYRTNMIGGIPILGELRDVPDIVKFSRITRVVAVGAWSDKATLQYLRRKCALRKNQVLCIELLTPILRQWRRDAGQGKEFSPRNASAP